MISIVAIAEIAHEINRAYCSAIGDDSQKSWEESEDWQKESCIQGVHHHLQFPDETPSGSHENWLKLKRKEGWAWGPVKDPENKKHPCFLPYNELPVEQKAKDHIFRAVVRQLAPLFIDVKNI